MTIADGAHDAATSTFPIRWQRPEDELTFWIQNRMACPEPVPPLEASYGDEVYGAFLRPAAHYDLGLRMRARRVNTYLYIAVEPVPAPADDETTRPARAREKLSAAAGRLDELWQHELLPEVQEHLAYWERFDLRGAATPGLLLHLEETMGRLRRVWEIHFLVVFPFLFAMSEFDELHRELFGGDDTFGSYRLLQGLGNRTVDGNRALWRLSRAALGVATVREALAHDAADVLAVLEQSADGRRFLADLTAYLDEHGQRADRWGISAPFWVEDPTPVVRNLQAYVAQPDRDLEAELAAVAAGRERAVATARERLAGYPTVVVERFESLLRAAQAATVISEDHGDWIDFRVAYRFRRVLVELGRRLAEGGVIEEPGDVFYLTLDELRVTAAALPSVDRRQLVHERHAEMAHFATIVPPATIGMPPDDPPPADPIGRALEKMIGTPPEPSLDPTILRGNAASAGSVRGPARVIRRLADAGRLRPGDVLVTETTAPPWTPMFAIAAAVVTETGGILSHCAVVAREYGIPAVVGADGATRAIRDGQIVEVDGDAGLVRIV